MNRSMINASVTMGQLQQKLNTVSNNMANVNTNGFKSRNTEFQELLVQQMNNQPLEQFEEGRNTPQGIRSGTGAAVASTMLDMDQGSLKQTDRDLDLALNNPRHLFTIDTADGQTYTRDGSFYLSPSQDNPDENNIVTANGDAVLGQNGPITVPADAQEITITEQGEITVKTEDGTSDTVDTLNLAEALKPQLLEAVGNNQFIPADNEDIDADAILQDVQATTGVKQGFLEQSNVNLEDEMTNMIEMQRHYEFNGRAVSIGDQMKGLVNGMKR